MKFAYFAKKLRDVRLSDMVHVFPMLIARALSPIYKKKYADTWLVCEEKREARDNGYHFFKYMCAHQPQQPCVYAIDKRCPDAALVASLGPTVHYGSLRHWLMYFCCRYNISSQKGGKPNAALCSFFELSGWFKPHNVFLQHGVTKDKNDWLMADKCRFDYFVTAMASEDAFVRRAFGYDPAIVHFTGFPRFDNLHDNRIVPNRIVIMPTWRKWLRLTSEHNRELDSGIEDSEFRARWMELLDSDRLAEMIERYNLEIIFYPHRGMQAHIDAFKPRNSRIIVASAGEYDVQSLLKSSEMLITDYSSVYFDMFYMKKPVIFYQFDEETFRKYHYEEGWFDYHNNPFGTSYRRCDDVLEALEACVKARYAVSPAFAEAHAREFTRYDRDNSARIYRDLAAMAR